MKHVGMKHQEFSYGEVTSEMPSDVKVKLVNRLLHRGVESLQHQNSTKKHRPGCNCQANLCENTEERSNVKKTSSEN